MTIAMIGQKGIPATFGGIERHVEELSARLTMAGHLVIAYTRPYYTAPKLTAHRGIRLISLPSLRTKHFDAISHTFLATLHAVRQPVDVIHYHGVGPALLSWLPKLLRSKAKVVVTFHCIDRKHKKWGLVARSFLRLGEWAAVTWPDTTIAVSRTIQQYCLTVYGRRTVYIPNGVNPMPHPQRTERAMLRRFGLRPKQYVLSVARLIPHKGVHYLIQAFTSLRTNVKLVIVGDGFYTDAYVRRLRVLAKNDQRIVFTGWRHGPALAAMFRHARLFVLPSETEGLPITLLEAGSFGLPLLASDIPENLEIIKAQAEPIGYTFKTADVADLRRQISAILRRSTMAKAMGQRARRVIEREFHWGLVVRQTERLYTHLRNTPSPVMPGRVARRVLVTND